MSTGATTPGQSGPESDGNERVLNIPQTSPSDCLMSYPGYSLGEGVSYFLVKMQLVYSTAPIADWANTHQSSKMASYYQI